MNIHILINQMSYGNTVAIIWLNVVYTRSVHPGPWHILPRSGGRLNLKMLSYRYIPIVKKRLFHCRLTIIIRPLYLKRLLLYRNWTMFSLAIKMPSSNGKNISALLALCDGNSLVTGEFPSQRPVTWSFDVFFDLWQNKRLSKHWWGWWFETPSRSLWRHSNVISNHAPASP